MTIPGGVHPLFAFGKYQHEIRRSLRFNASDSAYLGRSFSTDGTDRKKLTFSFWIKLCDTSAVRSVISGYDGSSTEAAYWQFNSGGSFSMSLGGASSFAITTAQVFRDPSAWYHFLISIDTTIASPSSDRIKLYVNGVQISAFSSSSYPSQNYEVELFNAGRQTNIGVAWNTGYGGYLNGYLADIHFIDGQALTPTSFGEFDATTGVWNPKAYTGGSYGTNGFHLDFADNSNNTASTLGKDTSPNGNNWTPVNLTVKNAYTSQIVSSSYASANVYNAVDGSDSTLAVITTTGSLVFNFAAIGGLPYSSSVVVRVNTGSGSPMAFNINGAGFGSYTLYNGEQDVTIVSGSGTLNSLVVAVNAGGGANFHSLDIDGVIFNINNYQTDSLVDVPTNGSQIDTAVGGEVRGNYCTLNPLKIGGAVTLSNGNLDSAGTTTTWNTQTGTIYVSSGKWYAEVLVNASDGSGTRVGVGIATNAVAQGNYLGSDSFGYAYYDLATKYNNASGSSYGAGYGTGDVIGIALDLDAGTLVFYKNGSSQGTAYSSLSGTFTFAVTQYGSGSGSTLNAGARPFAYTAPSGFKALCTTNLPAPLVTKPNTVMDVLLWSGNNASPRTFSGLGFSPDFVWIKVRSDSAGHSLFDTNRGAGKILETDGTYAEVTNGQFGYINSFTSDGFSVVAGTYGGYESGSVNMTGRTYVGWTWDAGSSTVSNTAGSITSQVRANATAGFSVVTFTAPTSTSATVGHGLNAAPHLIITKSRTITTDWYTYTKAIGASGWLILNATAAAVTGNSAAFGGVEPTSTVFTYGSGLVNTGDIVAYCFAPVVGYSSFGSYTGNGSTDGPFVYTGFRPRWVMIKRSDSASASYGWFILDTARNTYNVMNTWLAADSSAADGADVICDALSNGFKVRTTAGNINTNAGTFVFAAFAESPFNYSRAR